MLIGVFGDLGSGKTLFLVYLAQKSNCEVYANFTIKLPNVKVLTPELFFKILKENPEPNRPKLLLLDELYTLADSRTSVSLRNRLLSYLIFQSRKRNMDIVYTAQLYGSIDLRLRDLTHIIVVAEKDKHGFFYTFMLPNGKQRILYLPMEKAKKLYSLYDTYQLVDVFDVEAKKLKKLLESEH